ncbi:hypothetical protein IGL04_001690 [Enterococcus sp. AZ085]
MTCLRCNDEMVIWYKTSLGWSTCEPCPVCNEKGQKAKEYMEKRKKELRDGDTKQIRKQKDRS